MEDDAVANKDSLNIFFQPIVSGTGFCNGPEDDEDEMDEPEPNGNVFDIEKILFKS